MSAIKHFPTREEARKVARTCIGWRKVRPVQLDTWDGRRSWALCATAYDGAVSWLREDDFFEGGNNG